MKSHEVFHGLFGPVSTSRRKPRILPPWPTRYQKPILPDLSGAPFLCIDCETWDPELLEHGPGWARGVGHIVGIAVSDEERDWYFPMRHTVAPEQNLPPEEVIAWAKENLTRPHQTKVGANLLYDIGWLRHEGVTVKGDLQDVQIAEALLSETDRVNLEALGKKYVGEGKASPLLYQWCADAYGGEAGPGQRANIYRAPPSLVDPYARGDVSLPIRVLREQWPLMEKLDLLRLYGMENGLLPLLVAMRFAGVPVDVEAVIRARDALIPEEATIQKEVDRLGGFNGINVNAGAQLAKAFDKLRINYPRTQKGAPSFRKEFLTSVSHPFTDAVLNLRKLQKTRTTFLEGYIINANINGYVFPSFVSMREDDNGTRSGRFASMDPNFQNLPSRDGKMGPLVRSCIIPDPRFGHDQWRRHDYSQIEFRFNAHYAVGKGADEVRRRMTEDPKADYHEIVRQIIIAITGIELGRKQTKNINFGLIYGMGIAKLARTLGLSMEEAEKLFAAYHDAVPFVKTTMDATRDEAERTGAITTIFGRRSTFDLWVPKKYEENAKPLPLHLAVAEYGQVRRAHIHKALNRRLQGSAAELMKFSMLRCWEEGVYDVTGVPRLTVHDETDYSKKSHETASEKDAWRELMHIETTAIPLRVPVFVEESDGENWGQCL